MLGFARPSTVTAAACRRTAGRYWRLADTAEKEGHIARAREFVALAMMFDRRAAGAVDRRSTEAIGQIRRLRRDSRNRIGRFPDDFSPVRDTGRSRLEPSGRRAE